MSRSCCACVHDEPNVYTVRRYVDVVALASASGLALLTVLLVLVLVPVSGPVVATANGLLVLLSAHALVFRSRHGDHTCPHRSY